MMSRANPFRSARDSMFLVGMSRVPFLLALPLMRRCKRSRSKRLSKAVAGSVTSAGATSAGTHICKVAVAKVRADHALS